MTPRGHVVTRDGYWLRDVSEIRQRYTKHIYRRRLDPSAPSLAGTALSLVSRYASGNYHHWLFNVLTRAGLALEAGIAPASVEHVLVNRLSHAYQRETLDLLPFQASTVEVHHREGVRAHAVVATSATLWAHLASWAHRFLRDLLLPPSDPSADGPRRIFVCRGETASRPLVNEQECLAYFEQLGFVGVELATLPVREQAALFARATHVAGPHDAGLTNIAFCAPGATVIELFSPDHLDPAYVELGAVAGVDHLCAIGERCAVPGAKRAFSVPIDVCERLGALANL